MSSDTEKSNYFDSFEPVRVQQGEAISRKEMIRRLAHFTQVPQRYGYRLMLAFEEVMYDALRHGEGIKIKGLGTIVLERHKKDTYTGLGRTALRKILYRYKLHVGKEGKEFLSYISDLEREGTLNDYFSET